jgi:ABC-type transport system involved in multi-copper enzyme maturation permease subunit
MLTYDIPALRQTGSRNLTGQKTLPTIWSYMKLVTKYQISAINSCWEKCDEIWAYIKCMFNVYKNQQSRQTGSRHLMGPKTFPTIWGTYMKLVTKYQISTINSCWEKCDEKCAYMFNVYKNQLSRQTGSRNLTGPKKLPTIWHTYMKLVTKYQIPVINSCLENATKNVHIQMYMFNVYKNQQSRQTGSRNLMGPKTLPTIWSYMKLVTKYQISAINSCWEKCDEKWAYTKCMFNVYKNQQSRQTGSWNLMGPKTFPTIWGTYMKLVTKYPISTINSCWEKCDEKCAYMFNVYKNQLSRQTGSRNLTGPKKLPTIWHTYMKLVTKYQIPVINSCLENATKNVHIQMYMFNVYKNQQSQQTGSRNLMGPKTFPTIWGIVCLVTVKIGKTII